MVKKNAFYFDNTRQDATFQGMSSLSSYEHHKNKERNTRTYLSAGWERFYRPESSCVSIIVCFCKVKFAAWQRGHSLKICILSCIVKWKKRAFFDCLCEETKNLTVFNRLGENDPLTWGFSHKTGRLLRQNSGSQEPLSSILANRMRKRRVVGRIYGMKYRWKGHTDRNRHKNRIKRVGKLSWFMSRT